MNDFFLKFLLLCEAMFFSACFPLSAQYYNQREDFLKANSIWTFGMYAGLDFNQNVPLPLETKMLSTESSATVSDSSGRLLFYTDGKTVWNRKHDTMLNGANLFPWLSTSGAQSTLIVPVIDTPGKYYILTTAEDHVYGANSMDAPYLSYSVVDMTLDNGLGGVEANKKYLPIYNHGLLEPLISVPGNNCDIWVVGVSRNAKGIPPDTNLPYDVHGFVAWHITRNGIDLTPVYSNTGSLYNQPQQFSNCLAISPDGKNIALTFYQAGVALCRFNQADGTVSDCLLLPGTTPRYYSYGACFSPDNMKLYITTDVNQTLRQYDISKREVAEIMRSEYILATRGEYDRYGLSSALKLFKDTIYGINRNGKGMYRINNPNNAGSACNFELNSPIKFLNSSFGYVGLPNEVVIPVGTVEVSGGVRVEYLSCADSGLSLLANNPYGFDYLWNDSIEGPVREVSHSGTWWVRYRMSPCVYNTDTFHVLPPDYPILQILPACRQEANGMAYFRSVNGDNTFFTYSWHSGTGQLLSSSDSLTGLPAGNYSVSVSSGYCDTVVHFHIPGEDYRVSFDSDSTSCEGLELAFDNTSDAHFTVWDWSFGEGSGSSQESPVHVYHRSGSYVVQLTGHGLVCSDTFNAVVVVDAPVKGISFSVDRDSICEGERILFTPHVDTSAISLYWNIDSDNIFPAGNESVWYGYDVAGRHPAVLRAGFRRCPELTYTDTIQVYASPRVDLGPDSVICLGSAAVLLRNHRVTNADHLHHEWNTGDTSETLTVFHPGYYSLRISNSHGCVGSEGVRVYKDCHMDVPNVFTPNGDGVNDYFFPRQLLTSSVRSFRMHIFNRWGQVVFETDHAEGQGWDGKFNDRPQPSGVYIYLLEVIFDNGRQEQYRGNVSLLR